MWAALALIASAVALAAALRARALSRRLEAAARERSGGAAETERLALELTRQQSRYEGLIRELPIGVLVFGPGAEILGCNRAAVDLLGIPEARLLGKTCHDPDWDVIREDGSSFPSQSHPAVQALASGRAVRNVIMGFQRPATWDRAWLLVSADLQTAGDGRIERVVCTLLDITARKRLESQVQEQSFRDPLTGCFNRRFIAEFERWADARRGDWGCIVADVDGLKEYNETYGHHAGDEALLRMSRFLTLQVRAGEAVVRLGGAEFLVLLVGVTEASIGNVVRRIRAEAARQAPLPFSMGWAIRSAGEPLEKTIDRASAQPVPVPVEPRELPQRRGPFS